ncbi:MAG: exo-beta-N-acetylmuramidase NamZ family protein [Thermodesulfobacteriota bacterium]
MPGGELGIERFVRNPPPWIKGARLGLLANQASVDSRFEHTSTLLARAFPGQLVAFFNPQHGFRGEKQDNMVESDHSRDPLLKVPIFSLYGESRTPSPEMFDHIDVLLVDVQDVGTRVYTFIYTLAYCMEAAGKWNKKVVILDRPNPIGGLLTEGNLLNEDLRSFVGLFPIPMRHGLTIGEIAKLWKGAFGMDCDLEVVPLGGWRRDMLFADTGLPWVMPSPNMPTPDTALVYPGQVIWEGTNVSEGRGTTRPFELFGAPFIEPARLKERIAKRRIAGVIFREAWFQPTFHKWAGEVCGGLQIHVTDPRVYRPYYTTLCLLQDILALYPDNFAWRQPPYEYEYEKLPIDLILGDDAVRYALEEGADLIDLTASWEDDLASFEELRRGFFLYE